MEWQVHLPKHPLLKQYIQCFWFVDMNVPFQREKILPTGTVEIILNFGDSFRLWENDGFAQQKDAWLVGLQSHFLLNEPLGRSRMMWIRFHAGGIYPFIPCDAHELHNQVLPLDIFWGNAVALLRESLHEAPNMGIRLAILESFLLERLREPENRYVHQAVQTLALSNGTYSIKGLANQIGISQKHLANRFKQVVGVTPKTLARIYRFQSVLSSINTQPAIDWADIALQCHYHDQAHFSKDFATFTGFSPSEYYSMMQPYLKDSAIESTHFVPVG